MELSQCAGAFTKSRICSNRGSGCWAYYDPNFLCTNVSCHTCVCMYVCVSLSLSLLSLPPFLPHFSPMCVSPGMCSMWGILHFCLTMNTYYKLYLSFTQSLTLLELPPCKMGALTFNAWRDTGTLLGFNLTIHLGEKGLFFFLLKVNECFKCHSVHRAFWKWWRPLAAPIMPFFLTSTWELLLQEPPDCESHSSITTEFSQWHSL